MMTHHPAAHHSTPTHHAAAVLTAGGTLLRAGIRGRRTLSLRNWTKKPEGEDNSRRDEHMLSHIDLLYNDHFPQAVFVPLNSRLVAFDPYAQTSVVGELLRERIS
jgi:hypothetical protein